MDSLLWVAKTAVFLHARSRAECAAGAASPAASRRARPGAMPPPGCQPSQATATQYSRGERPTQLQTLQAAFWLKVPPIDDRYVERPARSSWVRTLFDNRRRGGCRTARVITLVIEHHYGSLPSPPRPVRQGRMRTGAAGLVPPQRSVQASPS